MKIHVRLLDKVNFEIQKQANVSFRKCGARHFEKLRCLHLQKLWKKKKIFWHFFLKILIEM